MILSTWYFTHLLGYSVNTAILLQMAHQRSMTTLGELLEEHAETDQDEEILDRIKILAQEHLPDGWTHWEVTTATREEIFGDKIEPNVLNKLVYALPTVGLARAFVPEAEHLSEKGYREIRTKLLDWAFTRALILGPPFVANRIRGSAARTEFFKEAVEAMRPLMHTRSEADRILSGCLSESEKTCRKRSRTFSLTSQDQNRQEPTRRRRRVDSLSPSSSQNARIEALEQKMEGMFSILLEKLEHREQVDSESDKENNSSDSDLEIVPSQSLDSSSWKAPALSPYQQDERDEIELEFLPSTKEADPLIPEPSAELKSEGIECQRLGTGGWNRIRYKEVEKHLHAGSVFSALKINNELGALASQPSPFISKQEGMLGTITHGLLLQRRAFADGLNAVIKKVPSVSAELKLLVAEDSKFKSISDQLLQYVCAHRSETIELRRKHFKTKNELLSGMLNSIPPSPTHLFHEEQLSSFVKDNGGVSTVFISPRTIGKPETTNSFRKPAPLTKGKSKKPTWRSRQPTQSSTSYHTASHHAVPHQSAQKSSHFNQRKRKVGNDKKPKQRSSRNTY